ncbi:trigger factor [Spiroplasma endosymbiont of Crioceris asparagi]|uniref:trigger factor n=1 Tax=Spiroplasma endosymbiont of Crioceris asparagi TaxID=3066286 RepID=UPI0030D0FEF3
MNFKEQKSKVVGQGQWIITIDGKEWKELVVKGKNRVRANVQIDGFRKGKAPESEIVKYLTPDKYLREAYRSAIMPAFDFAKSQETKIEPFSSPAPKVTKINEEMCEIVFEFDLKPIIKINSYTGYKGKDLVKEEAKVTKEELEKAIEDQRNKMALEKTRAKTAAIKDGDVVVFDFEGFVDGKTFEGGKAQDYKLTIGSNQFIPGFETSMIGKKLGKTEIEVKFPKDYGVKDLSNKKAIFKLDIKEIKERILPKKDDELALDLNIKNVKTYKELEEYITENIKKQKQENNKNIFVNNVIRKIVEASEIEIPKSAIDGEVQNLYKEFEQKVMSQGLTMKIYQEQTGLTNEAIKAELVDDATARLQSYLVTDHVRNSENFVVSDEESKEKLKAIATSFGVEEDYLLKNKIISEQQIAEEVIREKIVEFLFQNNG